MLKRNAAAIKIIFVSTEPYRRGSIVKAITLSSRLQTIVILAEFFIQSNL